MRTALYARYSDGERQNDRSIEDQFAVLRRHAEARGWTVVETFCDRGIPGFSMANRPGILDLLKAAEARAFDLVLAEDEDRLARSQIDLPYIKGVLEFLEIPIATLETDRVDDMRVALKGLIGADYLKTLGRKTARSMRENAERGLATGSRLYGYRSSPGGAIEVVPEEAAVVCRIHGDYARGLTSLDIAAALNREGVPGPRGGRWNRSSITGSRSRANGILHTEIYAGVKVYNRVLMRKDPRTGKRLPKIRPASEWVRVPVPHLRIVPEDLWGAVQARLDGAAAVPAWALSHGRRKGLFSGMVRCGVCGGGYITHGGGQLRCATRLERGRDACSNARAFSRAELERRVLDGLRGRLLRPSAVAHYVRAYHAAWQRRQAQEANRREPIEKRLAELGRSTARLTDAIARLGLSPAIEERLVREEAERARLKAQLEAAGEPEPPMELHPRTAERFAARIAELQARLEQATDPAAPPIELELRDAIRGLVDRIEVSPLTSRRLSPVKIVLHGRLAAFVRSDATPLQSWGVMVAGGSNSHTPTPTVRIAC